MLNNAWLTEHPEEREELLRETALELYEDKQSPAIIARTLDVDKKTVNRWITQHKWGDRAKPYDKFEDFESFEELMSPIPPWRSKSIAQRKLAVQLECCIARLKPAQQELIQLRFYEELTLQEIGRIFGVSYEAIQNRLKTVFADLRKAMAEFGHECETVELNEL